MGQEKSKGTDKTTVEELDPYRGWQAIWCLKEDQNRYAGKVPKIIMRAGEDIELEHMLRSLAKKNGFVKYEIEFHYDYPEGYEGWKHPGFFAVAYKDHKNFKIQTKNLNGERFNEWHRQI